MEADEEGAQPLKRGNRHVLKARECGVGRIPERTGVPEVGVV